MSSNIINDNLFKKVIEESDDEEEEYEDEEDETSKINSSEDTQEESEPPNTLWLLFLVLVCLCCLIITTLILAGIGVGVWKAVEAGKQEDCDRNLDALADRTFQWLLRVATLNHTQGQTEVPVYFSGSLECQELYKSDFELVRII